MIVIHLAFGGALTAACGQNVARAGHTGAHDLIVLQHEEGSRIACGHCWEWWVRVQDPKHNAGRDSEQAHRREGIEFMRVKLTGQPYEGRRRNDRQGVAA